MKECMVVYRGDDDKKGVVCGNGEKPMN